MATLNANLWTATFAIARLLVCALAVTASAIASDVNTTARPSTLPTSTPPTPTSQFDTLQGKLLVARPSLGDPRFKHTVIFMVRHDATGAFGLVVNRPLKTAPASSLFKSPTSKPFSGDITVHSGGPVEPASAFVLHTTDYSGTPTILVNDDYAVSQTPDIIAAMQSDSPPSGALFLLGYAGWGKDQIERELASGSWAIAPATLEIVFGDRHGEKWRRAFDNRYLDI